MVVQGRLLMTMIEIAVEQLDQMLPAVGDLELRHAGYGVKAADYDAADGQCPGRWSPRLGVPSSLRDAWVAYCQTLAGEMKAAAS
jgi:hypothetical protein